MEDRKYKIKLFLYDEPELERDVEFYKNDTNTCIMNISLFKDRSTKYLVDGTVSILINKPDGTEVVDILMKLNDGEYIYELPNSAINVVGNHTVTVQCTGSNNDRTTFMSFKYKIKNVARSEDIYSENNYPILTKLLSDNYSLSKQVNAAEALRGSNEEVRKNNEETRKSNETLRQANFDKAIKEYESYKNVMIAESNVAALQNQINAGNAQLADIKNKDFKYLEHILPAYKYPSDITKISAFGDSITYGYGETYRANTYPTVLGANLQSYVKYRDILDENNYYNTIGIAQSSGCSLVNGEYTLTRSINDENPRFMCGSISIDTDVDYKMKFNINKSSISTAKWNVRLALLDENDVLLQSNEYEYMYGSNNNYETVSINIGIKYLKTIFPNLKKFKVGIGLLTNGVDSTIKVKDIGVYKSNDILSYNTVSITKSECTIINNYDIKLLSTSSELKPRCLFQITDISLISGKYYGLKIVSDNTYCVGSELKPRLTLLDNTNTTLVEINEGSYLISKVGLNETILLIDIDSYKKRYPTLSKFRVGVTLNSNAANKYSVIKSIELIELTNGVIIFNDGVSGNTITDGIARINSIVSSNPNICIIAFGTNDIRLGVTIETFLEKLQIVIDSLININCIPIIATLPPLGEEQLNYDLINEWNREIKYFAAKQNLRIWDRYWALNDGDTSLLFDGRHPNSVGYRKLGISSYNIIVGNSRS